MHDQFRRSTTVLRPGASFDDVVLPHLDVGYRLARWLMRNEHDAEDAVQEASLRAFRYFRTFTGGDGRTWFLRIVRNVCFGWRGYRYDAVTDPFDEEQHHDTRPTSDPETLLLRTHDATLIARAMSTLPGSLSSTAGASRARGAVVPGAGGRGGDSHRHRDVEPVARPSGVPRGAGPRARAGRRPSEGLGPPKRLNASSFGSRGRPASPPGHGQERKADAMLV